jgi:Dullard-like phosphatase family protein
MALVLDLDHTLIHTTDHLIESLNPLLPVFKDRFVYARPGLASFLEYATERFEVFVYTFGRREYAEPILDEILPDLDDAHRLYNDSCFLQYGLVYKDLDMLGRDLKRVVMVEDNEWTAGFYPTNSIVVPKWNLRSNDTVLTTWLPELLELCLETGDVRELLERWRLRNRR